MIIKTKAMKSGRHILFLFMMLNVCVLYSQELVFGKSKSKAAFALQSGRKYTLTLMDGKRLKGNVKVIDAGSLTVTDELLGETAIAVKNLKAITERRHLWCIAAWASLIKVNKTVELNGRKVTFKPRII